MLQNSEVGTTLSNGMTSMSRWSAMNKKKSRILKDYEESGAMNALVSILAALDERIFLTKSGDVLMAINLKGLDYECKDALELDQLTRRFGSALRILGEDCRLYQYLIKRD